MESYRSEILRQAEERYGTQPEYLWAAYPAYAVLRRSDNRKWYALIADVERSRLGLSGTERTDILNVKCDSRMIGTLRQEDGFLPAYHMHRGSWISILLDGTVPLEQIEPLVEMSYHLAGPKQRKKTSMQIRHAQIADLNRIMEIYAKARRFMAEHGNPRQWGNNNWPPEQLIREDIQQRKCYVCIQNSNVETITGTFYFDAGEDVEATYAVIHDGAWKGNNVYGVVHRLASDGSAKGTGEFCLNWAFAQCGHLRVDTHKDNRVMQNLLSRLNFQYCGIIYVREDNDPRLAYEKLSGTG